MSASSWPPDLKYVVHITPSLWLMVVNCRLWVQQCMSKAGTSNKEAVNAELKKVSCPFENFRSTRKVTSDLIAYIQ